MMDFNKLEEVAEDAECTVASGEIFEAEVGSVVSVVNAAVSVVAIEVGEEVSVATVVASVGGVKATGGEKVVVDEAVVSLLLREELLHFNNLPLGFHEPRGGAPPPS